LKISIASSSESKLSIFLAAGFGIASAFVILSVLPMGIRMSSFFCPPRGWNFFLLMIIDVKIAMILLLFTRAPWTMPLGSQEWAFWDRI
jgi:hypothetical protein